MNSRATSAAITAILVGVIASACGREARNTLTAAKHTLHLEDHIADAVIKGGEVPRADLETFEWRFSEPQPAWKVARWGVPAAPAAELERTSDALRVTLPEGFRTPTGTLGGGIYIDLPDWNREDWPDVVVRARAAGRMHEISIGLNAQEGILPFQARGGGTAIISDGSVQTYQIALDWRQVPPAAKWNRVGLWFRAREAGSSIDLLSVTFKRGAAAFADSGVGLRELDREGVLRPALFTHAPSRMGWRVRVPDGGKLGMALTTLGQAVTFSVTVASASGEKPLFREVVKDATKWHVRSVDLSAFAGRTVDLVLNTESERRGQLGFWGSPILSGSPPANQAGVAKESRSPNVILYVIDGGGADLMSLYGYNRRTTPNLERLAAEAVVFDHAHSNSAWTKPSTASFMTSLQHSALGGFRDWGDRIPEAAPTMAQRFRAAGYQTAVFTFHPNAGRPSALNRGVDRFQDRRKQGQEQSESSRHLQTEFWEWRKSFPGNPYWAHFQVTDVHEPQVPVPPFEGLFIDAARRERFMGHPPPEDFEAGNGWVQKVLHGPGWERYETGKISLAAYYREKMAKLGIDRIEFYDIQRGLYDETMAHADHQLGRFVDRLKATGQWEDTFLIVTADHGHPAGSHTRFGRELFDPPPPETEGAFFDSYRTRVPLMILAPGRVPAGVRIQETVSLVDLLPTVLELAGLPPLERTQGRSLVPLIRGDAGWETRPVILEQVERDVRTDEFTGHIEMIDGRWGASLEIWPKRRPGDPPVQPSRWEAKARFHVDGQPRLLLYDLWEDPFARQNVNARYPELVEKYTRLLEARWREHQAFATLYKSGGQSKLSPEQVQTLKSLGYIR